MPTSRRLLVQLVDLLLVLLATYGALLLSNNLYVPDRLLQSFVPYSVCSVLAGACAIAFVRLEQVFWRFASTAVALRVVAVAAVTVFSAAAITFAYDRLEGISRAVPFLQFLLIVALMLGARAVMRLRYRLRRGPKQLQRSPVAAPSEAEIVIGMNWLCDAYLRSVEEFGGDRRQVAAVLGRHARHVGRMIGAYEVLGTSEQIEHVIQSLGVHGVQPTRIVITCKPEELGSEARAAIAHAGVQHNLEVEFLTDRLGLSAGLGMFMVSPHGTPDAAMDFDRSDEADEESGQATKAASVGPETTLSGNVSPVFSIQDPSLEAIAKRPYWKFKRALDIVFALFAMVVLSPLFLISAVLTWINVGRPLLFWQQRPGLCGHPFKLYKFRTLGSEVDKNGKRVPDDRRLSSLGAFMRRTRLDELPQLYSILIGDMSLVGPRPLLPVDQAPEFSARLLVRPGLAGWAQVCGGRDISAADKAALDVWYLHNASFWLDLQIILRTIPIVLLGERISRERIERAWRDLQGAGVVRRTEHRLGISDTPYR